LPQRRVAERTFVWRNHHHRLSKGYEVLLATSETIVHITTIRIMIQQLDRI
jgi:transposase